MYAVQTTLILMAGLGLLGCNYSPKREQFTVTPSPSAGAAASVAPVQRDPRMHGWRSGERYRYRLEMSSRVALDPGSALSDFELESIVELAPLQVSGDTANFVVSMEAVKVVSHLPGTQSKYDDLALQLKQRYQFTMSGGLVTDSYFAEESTPIAAGVFRTVSASLQFARSQKTSQSFETEEYDTTGPYIAEYKLTATPSEWQKHKLRYLNILLPKGMASAADSSVIPAIINSNWDIVLSESGRPSSVHLSEEIQLKGAQAPLSGRNKVAITSLEVKPPSGPLPVLEDSRKGMVHLAANEPYESRVSQDALDDAMVNGATFADLVRRFERAAFKDRPGSQGAKGQSASADHTMSDEDTKDFTALGALLRRHPETVKKAIAKVEAKSPAAESLVDGLGSAGTAQAQAALAGFTTDKKLDPLLRSRALIALSRVEHPSSDSVKSLIVMLGDSEFGTQARYGLGTYCRLLRESGDAKQSTDIGNLLVRLLDESKSESQISTNLRALANAGYSPAYGKVLRYLNDKQIQVRVDAVRGLRLMDIPAADSAIAKTLTEDSSMLVQLAAIESMLERRPSDVMTLALVKASHNDDAHVRYRATQLMIRWLATRPDLRQSIEAVAKNDQEPKLRELAAAGL